MRHGRGKQCVSCHPKVCRHAVARWRHLASEDADANRGIRCAGLPAAIRFASKSTGEALNSRDRYIDLLRDALTMSLWSGADGSSMPGHERIAPGVLRDSGRDWPNLAHTMIGARRMRNLQECVEDVLARDVPGDLVETGVWRGGACIFMRGILAAYDVTDRRVWVADSFEGLPAPDLDRYPVDGTGAAYHLYPQLAVSQEQVEENFRRYGLLDDQVVMLKGFFRDTLPTAPIDQIAVLRLDGDMYESTMDALTSLYPKLVDGGYLIIDDYSIEACRKAVSDFREARGIVEPIHLVDWTGVFWRKGDGPGAAAHRQAGDLLGRYQFLTGEFSDHMREELRSADEYSNAASWTGRPPSRSVWNIRRARAVLGRVRRGRLGRR